MPIIRVLLCRTREGGAATQFFRLSRHLRGPTLRHVQSPTLQNIRQLDEFTYVVDCARPDGKFSPHLVAGLGARFVAKLYDGAIIAAFFGVGAFALIQFGPALPRWVWPIAFLFADTAYHLFFELLTAGQSPGKNVVGIRVVSAAGVPPAAGQMFVRNIARLLDFLPFAYFAGGVRALLHPPAHRWGDDFARTLVVYREPFRDMLFRIRCGPEAYSTSLDAFLLESYLLRAPLLEPASRDQIAAVLAERFQRRYAIGEDHLVRLYDQHRFHEFLEQLYLRERARALTDANEGPAEA